MPPLPFATQTPTTSLGRDVQLEPGDRVAGRARPCPRGRDDRVAGQADLREAAVLVALRLDGVAIRERRRRAALRHRLARQLGAGLDLVLHPAEQAHAGVSLITWSPGRTSASRDHFRQDARRWQHAACSCSERET
jgi:hypothetical protein